jgi:DNA-binding NtrC family response regulator
MPNVPPILIVEDEVLIRMDLVATLEAAGFTVVECGDGASALKHIDALDDIQGLITDIKLGSEPNGWAVAHYARRKFPCLAVVYITGDSVAAWSAEGVPSSVILQKPFADAQLTTAISSLLTEAVAQKSMESPSPNDQRSHGVAG